MKSVFLAKDVDEMLARINRLSADSKPLWGKMDAAKMFAHLNVQYEMAYSDEHPKATGIKKFLLNIFVKNGVVGPKPYPKNSRTAPQFIIKSDKDFETEKTRLVDFIHKTQKLGEDYFEGKESNSFGVLTVKEWSNSFYKHNDHHLKQFGV